MRKNLFQFIHVMVTLSLAVYVFVLSPKEKKAYIDNQRLFDRFAGKAILQEKLETLARSQRSQLDSVAALATGTNAATYESVHQQMSENFAINYQQVSTRYTADIWKELNKLISEYGKQNGYDFIFGATGDGSLMYANEVKDLTEEVINYVNERHAKN
ncbi:MAG TPA: OmpH family outer membrane protein [Chryseosolibacter sp.]